MKKTGRPAHAGEGTGHGDPAPEEACRHARQGHSANVPSATSTTSSSDPRRRVPGTDASTWTSYVEPINYSSERRQLVAMLIEKGLSDEALYPTRVVPPVPRAPYSNIDLAAIAEWAAVESKRLTENAPEAIQGVFEQNKLRKMKRELPRREYIREAQGRDLRRVGETR